MIDDTEDQHTWCSVRYSSLFRMFDSVVYIFHFFIPLSINLLSAIIIIVHVARSHANVRTNQTYTEHFKEELRLQKYSIINPILNVILSIPRLIISFLTGCIQPTREPQLFLFGYLISFVPSILIFVVFVIPSEQYKKEFKATITRIRKYNFNR